jgi:hypothetical protein
MRAHVLYWLRQVHLYVGVFTAPAILFFAFTGALQTLSLNDRSPDGSYTPPHWISVLAQIHKKQSAQLPQRRPSPPEAPGAPRPVKTALPAPQTPQSGADKASAKPQPAAKPIPSKADAFQHPPKPVALKAFFLLVCVSLFASTISGAWMAWKFRRGRLVLAAVLLAGIVIPLALMKF